ncbi:MAG: murein biosynthesis integral membrane protein MurJ [Myxococcota bacterium]|jgi:putative peptidoglycan lipid II flippase
MSEKSKLTRSASGVGAMTMVSRITGFLRDAVVSYIFGAGAVTDAFNIAFTIPNLFRRLLAEGTLSIALVPVFSSYETTRSAGEKKRLYDATLSLMFAALFVVTVLGVIFSPYVVKLFAPGFVADQLDLAVMLNRVMFPFLLLVGLTSFFIATLYAKRSFMVPAVAPILLNVSQIIAAVALCRLVDPPILGLAAGVLAGGAMQLLFESVAAGRMGYMPGLRWEPSHADVKKMLMLMVPATLGIAIYQINVMVSRALASFLPKASITYIYLSDRLLELPLGVFAVAVATVSLPALSAMAARADWASFRKTISFAVRLTMFICIPAMAGLMVLRVPVISLLFQHGEFNARNTMECSAVVFTGLMGIWSVAGARNLAQAFYALNDTKTPVKAAFISFVVNLLCSLALMKPLGAPGLTLANSVSSAANFFVLAYMLDRKTGGWGGAEAAGSALKSFVAAAVMAAAIYPVSTMEIWLAHGHFMLKAAILFGTITGGCVVYALAAYFMKQPELHSALEKVKGRLRR